MKKLLFDIAALMLMVGCSSKTENTVTGNEGDSIINDSSSMIVEGDSTIEKNVEDSNAVGEKSLSLDTNKITKEGAAKEEVSKEDKAKESSKPSPNAKEIDKLLKNYMLCANQHNDEIRAGNQYDSYLREIDKEAGRIDKQLRKFKGEMTKEQLAKYKKADRLLSKTPI